MFFNNKKSLRSLRLSVFALEVLCRYFRQLGAHGGDGGLVVLGAEDRRAGDKGIRARLSDLANIVDRKSTRLNSSHMSESRMPSSA